VSSKIAAPSLKITLFLISHILQLTQQESIDQALRWNFPNTRLGHWCKRSSTQQGRQPLIPHQSKNFIHNFHTGLQWRRRWFEVSISFSQKIQKAWSTGVILRQSKKSLVHNLFWTTSQRKDWTLGGTPFYHIEALKVLSPRFTILSISKEQVLTV
jgi:hypothetical protein